jgi:uncharacterized protein (TIGR04562 family)
MDQQFDTKRLMLDKWSFNWPIMQVMIGGRSSIDLPEIQIANRDEATKFIRSYGYDPEKTHDSRLIHAVIIESLGFIERQLMPKEWKKGVIPPQDILNCTDARDLLMWSGDRSPENNQRRMWACAVLRVMHTIAHIEGAFRYSDIDAARDEIMARFQSILSYQNEGIWLKYGEYKIPLSKLEWKAQKSRESVLLKLLHKRANVAETIYDMIGVRIVTHNQADALEAVNILYKSHVISFPNAIPSRARNTLVDPDVFRAKLDAIRGELLTNKITPDEFEKKIMQIHIETNADSNENQHSGDDYHAIQLTGRQLIRTPRPLTILRKNLEAASKAETTTKQVAEYYSEMASILKNIARVSGDEDFAFFPFEIQVMDQRAWEINSTGKASHSRYKKSQIRAARRRVLNEILPLS